MPFVLRSDEELIAEARRALEALGVEVVIDRASSSAGQSLKTTLRTPSSAQHRVAILTSRAAIDEAAGPVSPLCSAVIQSSIAAQGSMLSRHHQHLDTAAAATAWWRRIIDDPQWRYGYTCGACRQRVPRAPGDWPPCLQCYAGICTPCSRRIGDLFKCPQCSAWYLGATSNSWGVPWDMPRPAPTRREAAAVSSALPPRMAAAVGPDGWLRPPPQHQRMHPVDVLVDGVLAALDGHVTADAYATDIPRAQGGSVAFVSMPLSEQRPLDGGDAMGPVRCRLKEAVDRLLRQEPGTMPLHNIKLEVRAVAGSHGARGGARTQLHREGREDVGASWRVFNECKLLWAACAGAPQGGARAPHGGQARV